MFLVALPENSVGRKPVIRLKAPFRASSQPAHRTI